MKDRQIVAGAGVTLSDQADENRLLKIVREFYDQVLKSNRVDLHPVYRADITDIRDADKFLTENDSLTVLIGKDTSEFNCVIAANTKWIEKHLTAFLPKSDPLFELARNVIAKASIDTAKNAMHMLRADYPLSRPSELFNGRSLELAALANKSVSVRH